MPFWSVSDQKLSDHIRILVLRTSVSDPYLSKPDLDPVKNLNPDPDPDPDPSYFFTLSEKKLKLLHYNKFLSSKEIN